MANRIVKLEDTYPSNSYKSKEKKEKALEEEKADVHVEKIVKGTVKKQKRSTLSKIHDEFGGDDAQSIGRYILYDVLIPAFKDTLFKIIQDGTSRALFGEGERPNNIRQDRSRSYVSYSRYYDDRPKERRFARATLADYNMDNFIFETRDEAEDVLSAMVDLVSDYNQVSVADLYSLVGSDSAYTDQKWGWDNLSRAYVRRTRSGYQLVLPRVILLD